MLLTAFQQVITLDRTQLRGRASLLCMAPIGVALAIGLALHRPVIGMIAAGGAMSVGRGSFQQVCNARLRPMLDRLIGSGAMG